MVITLAWLTFFFLLATYWSVLWVLWLNFIAIIDYLCYLGNHLIVFWGEKWYTRTFLLLIIMVLGFLKCSWIWILRINRLIKKVNFSGLLSNYFWFLFFIKIIIYNLSGLKNYLTKSVLFVWLSCRHDHMHVFGVWQVELQIFMSIFFDDVEAAGVFRNVWVEQVVVDMQQIVEYLPVVAIVVIFDQLALLQTFVTIPSVSCKTVKSHLVHSIQIQFFSLVNHHRVNKHPLARFFTGIPRETYSRKCGIPACQIGKHADVVFQSLQQNSAGH